MLTLHPVYTRHKHKHKKMETIPFSYACAYVTPGLHGLPYAYVYACAYAYVVRVNQALRLCSHGTGPKWIRPYRGTDHFCSHGTVPFINVCPHGTGLLLFGTESK